MKSLLVFLGLVALAIAEPWHGGLWGHWAGHGLHGPVDTPEVAAAKAAHFAAKAAAVSGHHGLVAPWGVPGHYAGAWAHGHAHGVPLPVHDTPEVAAAKAAHLAVHHAIAAGAGHGYAGAWAGHGGWGGHDGQWHGEGLAESQDHGHWNGWNGGWGAWNGGHHDDGQWHGEGLAESQDHGHWAHHGHRWRRHVLIAPLAHVGHVAPLVHPLVHTHVTHLGPSVYSSHWW